MRACISCTVLVQAMMRERYKCWNANYKVTEHPVYSWRNLKNASNPRRMLLPATNWHAQMAQTTSLHGQICHQSQLRALVLHRASVGMPICVHCLSPSFVESYASHTCCTASDLRWPGWLLHMCTVQLPQLRSCCACSPALDQGLVLQDTQERSAVVPAILTCERRLACRGR
jgi:hypothetical protein